MSCKYICQNPAVVIGYLLVGCFWKAANTTLTPLTSFGMVGICFGCSNVSGRCRTGMLEEMRYGTQHADFTVLDSLSGHYTRRIKSLSLSIPCIVGPHTSINAILTLVSHTSRV